MPREKFVDSRVGRPDMEQKYPREKFEAAVSFMMRKDIDNHDDRASERWSQFLFFIFLFFWEGG